MLLSAIAEAGFLFQDIRPKSYKKERKLDIHTGNLFSPYTLTTHDMYYLNYCESTNAKYNYDDDNVENEDTEDFEQGVTMWDTNLHESFFQVSVFNHLSIHSLQFSDSSSVFFCSVPNDDIKVERVGV